MHQRHHGIVAVVGSGEHIAVAIPRLGTRSRAVLSVIAGATARLDVRVVEVERDVGGVAPFCAIHRAGNLQPLVLGIGTRDTHLAVGLQGCRTGIAIGLAVAAGRHTDGELGGALCRQGVLLRGVLPRGAVALLSQLQGLCLGTDGIAAIQQQVGIYGRHAYGDGIHRGRHVVDGDVLYQHHLALQVERQRVGAVFAHFEGTACRHQVGMHGTVFQGNGIVGTRRSHRGQVVIPLSSPRHGIHLISGYG